MRIYLKEVSAREVANGSQWEQVNESGKRWIAVDEKGTQVGTQSFIFKQEAEKFAQSKGEYAGELPMSSVGKVAVIKQRPNGTRFLVLAETTDSVIVKQVNPNNGQTRKNAKEVTFLKDQMFFF